MKRYLFVLFWGIPCMIYAQDTVTVDFDPAQRISHHPRSHGWQMLAKPRQDSIGYRGENILPVYPDLTDVQDTVFGNLFFDHGSHEAFPKIVFYLVTNSGNEDAAFWVDRNMNADFTDDGDPLRYNMEDSAVVIRLTQPADERFFMEVRLFPGWWVEDISEDPAKKEFLEGMFGQHPNFESFQLLPVERHLYDQDLRVLARNVVIEEDSFRLGIGDLGSNGRYNDDSTDRIYLAGYGEDIFSSDFFDGANKYYEAGSLIKPNQQTYRVVEVDPYGSFLKLVISDEPFPGLTNGDILPDFKFKTHEGKRTTLYEMLDLAPYTLIDVWGSWCGPCRQETPELKEIHESLAGTLQVLSVTEDTKENALQYIEEQEIPWDGVWMTDAFRETATNGSYPFHILVGPDREVIKFDVYLSDLENYLEE